MGNDLLTRSIRVLSFAALCAAIFFSFAGIARADCDAVCQASFISAHNAVRARVSSGIEPGPNGTLDGNGQYDALTDGVLILRYLFGMTGTALTANALAPNATRNTPALVLAQLALVRSNLDVDGNGKVDALTDGLMIFRYLSGWRGAALLTGAVGSRSTNVLSTQIEAYIASLKP